MSTPNYKLKAEHGASIGHVRELYAKVVAEFATLQNTYGKTYVDEQLGLMMKKDGTRTATNTLQYATEPVLANRTDIPHLGYAIDGLALKANQSTTYTKTETDTALAAKLSLSGGTMTGNLNMGGNRIIQTYNPQVNHDVVNKESLDLGLATKKTTGTFDTKIQHASTNSAIDCSGANQIDIKVNGAVRGQFFQPTGQATTPLGLLSSDKLQIQSALSSTSVFGSKPLIDPLNTHGLYVGGIDDQTKNVQSTVNVTQGNA